MADQVRQTVVQVQVAVAVAALVLNLMHKVVALVQAVAA
jgi:hypothetical protein